MTCLKTSVVKQRTGENEWSSGVKVLARHFRNISSIPCCTQASGMTLGKSITLLIPQVPVCKNRDNHTAPPHRGVVRVNIFKTGKSLDTTVMGEGS